MVKKVKKKVVKKDKEDKYDQHEKDSSEGLGLWQYVNLKTKELLKNVKKKLKHIYKV